MNCNNTTADTLTIEDSDLETITIEEDDVQMVCEKNSTINNNVSKTGNKSNETYKMAMKDNELVMKFVERCLALEPNTGMNRVINKTLVPIYINTNPEYIQSKAFKRLMTKLLETLQLCPSYKFTHIKTLCESLKLHKKKRVNFVTLATNLNGKLQSRKSLSSQNAKKITSEIIDLENENEFIYEVPVTNPNNFPNQPLRENIFVNKNASNGKAESEENGLLIPDFSIEAKKTMRNEVINLNSSPRKTESKGNRLLIADSSTVTEDKTVDELHEETQKAMRYEVMNLNSSPRKSQSEDNRLLIPHTIVIEDEPSDKMQEETKKAKRIKEIEEQIAVTKKIIAKWEEAEVEDDSIYSPYILSERYKQHIVSLYKDLCKLTGSQAVKRREIRLQVLEGHPAGPVRRLEEFLNNNIGEDGDLPFPDFRDVVECVMKANKEDGLGWQKRQVENEARSLFTQCGRALQKRRQNREWRDLLGKVKLEKCDDDPADSDPVLMARLEENRRIAARKERDLMERFTNMQNSVKPTSGSKNRDMLVDKSNDLSELSSLTYIDHDGSTNDPDNLQLVSTSGNTEDALETNNQSNDITIHTDIKQETEMNISTSPECYQDSSLVKNVVKTEDESKQDIVALLNGLGDNYTATVIFDDPLLVIEISDSSDDECE